MTTTQNDRITSDRMRVFSGVSGGGDFFPCKTETADSGNIFDSATAAEAALAIVAATSGPNLSDIAGE